MRMPPEAWLLLAAAGLYATLLGAVAAALTWHPVWVVVLVTAAIALACYLALMTDDEPAEPGTE